MSFTDVFGGGTVQSAQVSFRAIDLDASVTLVWPISNQETTDVVARFNEVTPTTTGLAITMPDATEVSTGQDALFDNVGASTFSILDADGNVITTVASGVVVYIIIRDNSTEAGEWDVVQFGATTSAANAAALAGNGLVALANTLNTAHSVQSKAAAYTVVTGDRATTILYTGGADTLSLTAASMLGNNFFFLVRNAGTGALTINPNGSELIDGSATKTINQTESCFVICDGTGWYTVGYGRTSAFAYTALTLSVAGSADVTLSSAQAGNIIQIYTGVLTGNISVVVPTSVNIYYVTNATSGAFTLTVKTASGTGIAVTQGTRAILHCDGTNVVRSDTAASGTVTNIATGTGLTGGPITATGTIALANTAVTSGNYGQTSAPAVTLSIDAQGRITAASETKVNLASGVSGNLSVSSLNSGSGASVTTYWRGDGTWGQPGYLGVPINSKSTDYTLVIGDAGTCIQHPFADANSRTFTIPSNASVAFDLGTAVTFLNRSVLSLAVACADTMTLGGSTTTGTRTLAQNGVATAVKDTTTGWLITGIGLD